VGDKIIEPSEIFVEGERKREDHRVRANPWIRFFGRFFDYTLFFLLLWGLRQFLHGHFPFGKYESFIPFEFFVWIPIEALLLRLFGNTPGKWLVGTRLNWAGKKKPDYITALKRSFSVWFRGLGMMIPFINLLCMLVAYHKLKAFQITSWDRDDRILVTHRPVARFRVVLAAIVIVGGLLFYYSEKNKVLQLEKQKSGRVL